LDKPQHTVRNSRASAPLYLSAALATPWDSIFDGTVNFFETIQVE
jgi:hypothetical protein